MTLWTSDSTRLRVDLTQRYDPELDIAEDDTDAGTPYAFTVYTIVMEDYDGDEWFTDDLEDVARSVGGEVDEIDENLRSDNPNARASAYQDLVGYFGPVEFDQYPITFRTEKEFDWWWSHRRGEKMPSFRFRIKLENSDGDENGVLITTHDAEAARDDQSIEGSHWEFDGDDFAYAIIDNRDNLDEDLEEQGYEVDAGEWSPPDEEDGDE